KFDPNIENERVYVIIGGDWSQHRQISTLFKLEAITLGSKSNQDMIGLCHFKIFILASNSRKPEEALPFSHFFGMEEVARFNFDMFIFYVELKMYPESIYAFTSCPSVCLNRIGLPVINMGNLSLEPNTILLWGLKFNSQNLEGWLPKKEYKCLSISLSMC
ncbi:hypothetical protein ACJX0J_040900, partial [Zea mays]